MSDHFSPGHDWSEGEKDPDAPDDDETKDTAPDEINPLDVRQKDLKPEQIAAAKKIEDDNARRTKQVVWAVKMVDAMVDVADMTNGHFTAEEWLIVRQVNALALKIYSLLYTRDLKARRV